MLGTSLSDLMNAMVCRLDDIQTGDIGFIPEERPWHFIRLYMQVDTILAQLYKQYCEAKDHLGKLLAYTGANDPMTEIAWDMHDSLRSAIETRLLELRDDPQVAQQIKTLQQEQFNRSEEAVRLQREKDNAASIDHLIAFMLWVSLVMKDHQNLWDLRADFCQAS